MQTIYIVMTQYGPTELSLGPFSGRQTQHVQLQAGSPKISGCYQLPLLCASHIQHVVHYPLSQNLFALILFVVGSDIISLRTCKCVNQLVTNFTHLFTYQILLLFIFQEPTTISAMELSTKQVLSKYAIVSPVFGQFCI